MAHNTGDWMGRTKLPDWIESWVFLVPRIANYLLRYVLMHMQVGCNYIIYNMKQIDHECVTRVLECSMKMRCDVTTSD